MQRACRGQTLPKWLSHRGMGRRAEHHVLRASGNAPARPGGAPESGLAHEPRPRSRQACAGHSIRRDPSAGGRRTPWPPAPSSGSGARRRTHRDELCQRSASGRRRDRVRSFLSCGSPPFLIQQESRSGAYHDRTNHVTMTVTVRPQEIWCRTMNLATRAPHPGVSEPPISTGSSAQRAWKLRPERALSVIAASRRFFASGTREGCSQATCHAIPVDAQRLPARRWPRAGDSPCRSPVLADRQPAWRPRRI